MDWKRKECLSCPGRFVCAINIDMETLNCSNFRDEIAGLIEGKDRTPIHTLKPSARLQHAFIVAGIKTIGDLKKISKWEWLCHKGIGQKITAELNDIRQRNDIPWKTDERG